MPGLHYHLDHDFCQKGKITQNNYYRYNVKVETSIRPNIGIGDQSTLGYNIFARKKINTMLQCYMMFARKINKIS